MSAQHCRSRQSKLSVCKCKLIYRCHRLKKKGLVQLISCIPTSYPGHNILTEDLGEIIGEDDCKCGYKGKYFKIHGRVKESDIRGCSDAR